MQIIADLQLHSKYARAVSPEMTLPNIATWAVKKGISLMATGDWTHPLWFREIERDLEEAGNGLLQLKPEVLAGIHLHAPSSSLRNAFEQRSIHGSNQKNQNKSDDMQVSPYFMLATEVSSIYTQNGKGRRIHTLIWVPSLLAARKIGQEMTKRGCNLLSDGRPIIPLSSIHVAELVFTIEPKALIIPAHAWTPWFAVFGSMSGFDSLAEAFGPYANQIYAVETGLSSNPSMNWQIKELDSRQILSFSDAHSGPKIGREATVFEIPDGKLSYDAIYEAIRGETMSTVVANKNFDDVSVSARNKVSKSITTSIHGSEKPQNFVRSKQTKKSSIAYTIEFYPEEGKYHYTGHRACNIRWGPDETRKNGTTCPVCGKPLTQGVMQRVEQLCSRTETDLQLSVKRISLSENGPAVSMTYSQTFPNRRPFVMLVPLMEIISEAIGSPVSGKKVPIIYDKLVAELGGEFNVLLHSTKEQITTASNARIADGVEKVRTGDIVIDPGYDGVFGIVKIWKDDDDTGLVDTSKEQITLF